MSTEIALIPDVGGPTAPPREQTFSDRRSDVDGKMALVAQLLGDVGCEGLLLLEPENFAWLTSGATVRGALDPDEVPAVYCNGDQRWILCSNVDSPRLFEEELDGLGFQLKEWPWHWRREQLLDDLAVGRRIACDRPLADHAVVDKQMRLLRRTLTRYETACLMTVGAMVSHALEATCRTMPAGMTEREIAAQIAYRMIHRGVHAVHVGAAVDGRSRRYRQFGFTSMNMEKHAVVRATGRKYGICATASRSVCFGDPEAHFRYHHDTACKVSATYVASSWPDSVPKQILETGKHVYQLSGVEHEWRSVSQGHVTGRAPVELPFVPATEELLQAGWAITWQASSGPAIVADTILVTAQGPQSVTPTESWPLKRIRVQGAEFLCPDLLVRKSE